MSEDRVFYDLCAALVRGWLTRGAANPERSVQTVLLDALTDVLSAAKARTDDNPRLDVEILATLKGLESMSNSHNVALTDAVSKLAGDLSQLKTDLNTGIADLKAQVAAGQTPDFTTVDAAVDVINGLDASVGEMSAAVRAADPGPRTAPVPGPVAVVFNSADTTPNSAGGRNSSHLSNFDSTQPETA